ncbi:MULTISPECIES: hypothetical protein [Neisseria]|nr:MULTISPECIES: hypothetical protein [Neisseria]
MQQVVACISISRVRGYATQATCGRPKFKTNVQGVCGTHAFFAV